MSNFETATNFFNGCESLKGWEGCQQYVAEDATFHAQCEPLVDVTTVEAYCEWMAGLGSMPLKGCSYVINTSAYDEANNTAIFFGTLTAKHAGENGPVPATNKTTSADYVYGLEMDDAGHICELTNICNAPCTLHE